MSIPAPTSAPSPGPQPPRLLDQLRAAALHRFGRPEPGERYSDWARRYIFFHGGRHPRDLGAGDVGRFLEHIAQSEKDPLRCLEQAHEALTFLYKDLLHLNLGELPLPQPPWQEAEDSLHGSSRRNALRIYPVHEHHEAKLA